MLELYYIHLKSILLGFCTTISKFSSTWKIKDLIYYVPGLFSKEKVQSDEICDMIKWDKLRIQSVLFYTFCTMFIWLERKFWHFDLWVILNFFSKNVLAKRYKWRNKYFFKEDWFLQMALNCRWIICRKSHGLSVLYIPIGENICGVPQLIIYGAISSQR